MARSLDARTLAINSIVAEREAIAEAFASRWNVAVPYMQQVALAYPPTDLVERLRTGRKPWFQSGKDAQRHRESLWVSQRLFELEKSLVTELQAVANAWSRSGPAQVKSPATQPPPSSRALRTARMVSIG